MVEELVIQYGYAGLFLISFLAATLIPLGSEVFVVMMIVAGSSPSVVFISAATGNILGSVVNYYVGSYGGNFIFRKYFKPDSVKLKRAEVFYKKWGKPSLLLAWMPVIGDPLTVVAGIFRIRLSHFLLLVSTGKALRYAVLILLTIKNIS